MRHGLVLLAVWLLPMPARAEPTAGGTQSDQVEAIPDHDPAMAEAVRKARATFPAFLAASRHPKAGTGRYAVKIGLGEIGRREFFWLNPFTIVGDEVVGQLANTPEVIEGYRKGDTVTLPLTRITDWMYVDADGTMRGNFSACAIISHETPETRIELEREYHLDCASQ